MNDDQPYLNEEQLALLARLKTLQTEHADLDASIDALTG